MPTTTPFHDGQNGAEIRERLNAMQSVWLAALETAVGKDGWSPLLRVVADGQRQVIQLYDWIGGTTSKPAIGYVGAAGLVATPAEAVDFKGGKGDKGDDGDPGPANNLAGVDVSTGDPGTDATATVTGTYPGQRLVLDIPRGDPGQPGPTPNLTPGNIETGAPGTPVVATITGTPENPVLNLRIPQGQPGTGSGDVSGPDGVDDLQMTQFDGPSGKIVRALDLTGMLAVDGGRPYVAEAGVAYATPLQLEGKVNKVAGKGLSSNDFTNDERVKLANIALQATKNAADAYLLDRQNHTGTQAVSTVEGLAVALAGKQPNLVSGTNIKTINGQEITGPGNIVVAASVDAVRRPINASPAAGDQVTLDVPVLTGSAFLSLYGIGKGASQFQVSALVDFSTVLDDSGEIAGTSLSYTVAGGKLQVSSTYYWRVRYKDVDGAWSEWSLPTSFTTAAVFNTYIPTPAATPANFGDPFEGGFYTGMIWNELVQSSTSMAIAVGSKVFAVPNMTTTPIVYGGQQLEVRSRANPDNKMMGVVSAGSGGSLVLNVTSISGSGTFSDWSIMARYRVILAPVASGQSNTRIKNADTTLPAGTITLSEGRKATLAMVAAGTAAEYPAAHWSQGLSIGGYADWYIPGRDEIELLWRSLKPVTTANSSTERSSASTYNYQTLGSYADNSTVNGTNRNSAPLGPGYTATVPGQTALAAFKTGGAEAMTANIGTSSAFQSGYVWILGWNNVGWQGITGLTTVVTYRAVRRSII